MKLEFSARTLLVFAALSTAPAWAGDTTEAAIAGGIGGAVGAAVGSELGGRNGAIVGAGIVGAAGAVIAAHDDDDGNKHRHDVREAPTDGHVVYVYPNDRPSFCPPGQAKKGRC